jgi:hypothetical protein
MLTKYDWNATVAKKCTKFQTRSAIESDRRINIDDMIQPGKFHSMIFRSKKSKVGRPNWKKRNGHYFRKKEAGFSRIAQSHNGNEENDSKDDLNFMRIVCVTVLHWYESCSQSIHDTLDKGYRPTVSCIPCNTRDVDMAG